MKITDFKLIMRGDFLVFTKDLEDIKDPFYITVGKKYKIVNVDFINSSERDFKYINDAGKLDYISTSSEHFNSLEFYKN